jgi:hypothetical protein
MQHDLEKSLNMKLVLCIFEELLGLKIKFHKSELFYIGNAKDNEEQYKNHFGCYLGSFPFRYLGIPFNYLKI